MKLLIAALACVVLFGIAEGRKCPAGPVFACMNGIQMSDPCVIYRNLTAISKCLNMATKDCEQDASHRGVTAMIDQMKANATTYEGLCSAGCKDIAGKTEDIAKCVTKWLPKMGGSNAEDEEAVCAAYNGMIKCYKAAAGDCKALKDKIQEQIDQAAKMLDGKCSNAAGLGVSTLLLFIVSLMATKLF